MIAGNHFRQEADAGQGNRMASNQTATKMASGSRYREGRHSDFAPVRIGGDHWYSADLVF